MIIQDLTNIRRAADIYRKMAQQFSAYHTELPNQIYLELTCTRGTILLLIDQLGTPVPFKLNIPTPQSIPQDTDVATEAETNILNRLTGNNDYERLTNLMQRLKLLMEKAQYLHRKDTSMLIMMLNTNIVNSISRAFSLCWELQQYIKRHERDLRSSC